jgi:hypothetical protein
MAILAPLDIPIVQIDADLQRKLLPSQYLMIMAEGESLKARKSIRQSISSSMTTIPGMRIQKVRRHESLLAETDWQLPQMTRPSKMKIHQSLVIASSTLAPFKKLFMMSLAAKNAPRSGIASN